MRRFIVGSLVVGMVSAVPLASGARETATAPAGPLSPVEVQRYVESAGYTNVKDIEFDADDGHYEVDALSHAGKDVDLHVDPATGAVVPDPD